MTATDISAEMVAFGRERAKREGAENIEFVEADASSLSFPEGSFDAAVSRWGIIFDPDGEGAAARVRGFLKPGGRMAISSWGTADEVPFLGVPVRTVMSRLNVPPPPPGTPGPLSRPTEAALAGLLEGGGFAGVEAERMTITLRARFAGGVHDIRPRDRSSDHGHDGVAPAGGAGADVGRHHRGCEGVRRPRGASELHERRAARIGERLAAAEQNAKRVVDGFLELQRAMYAGGPVEPVADLLAADIVWHVPGRSPIAGEYRGREAVLDYFTTRRRLAGGAMKITKHAELAGTDVLVQLADGSVTSNGEEIAWRTAGVYRVAGGRIAEAWLVPLEAAAFDEAWTRIAASGAQGAT